MSLAEDDLSRDRVRAALMPRTSLLIYPHVIDVHFLRKDCRGIGVSRPGTTHRYIQQHEEWMIENPGGPGWKVCLCPVW